MENEVNGVLLLDKNQGITSNQALQRVKRLFGKNTKAGHTGSLDPLATGMLPICFGEATKFSAFLLNSDKTYLVTAQFGIKTDTGDLDGTIVASNDDNKNYNFTELQVELALKKFIGDVWQVPPIYSAIKQNGVRLYKLARENKLAKEKKVDIVVKPRLIKIYNIKLISICNIKQQITLEVFCSKGTYIRTLIEDLAAALNALATVASLRRITVGDFVAANMVSIADLEKLLATGSKSALEQLLLPVTTCLTSLPILKIDQINTKLLRNGKMVHITDLYTKFSVNTLICLITEKENLLGVGEVLAGNNLVARRLVKSIPNHGCSANS